MQDRNGIHASHWLARSRYGMDRMFVHAASGDRSLEMATPTTPATGHSNVNWITEVQTAAAEKVRAELAKPVADEREVMCDETFDPWELFPAVYGSYSADFDWTMLDVLRTLKFANDDDWDTVFARQRKETLAHHIFREMLCTAELCEYGTSPRVCFCTSQFEALLPELIEKWEAYSLMQWGEGPPQD